MVTARSVLDLITTTDEAIRKMHDL